MIEEIDYSNQHDNLVRMLQEQIDMSNMPLVVKRHEIFDPVVILNREVIEIGDHSRIDSYVKLEGGLGMHIGEYVHIASFAHIGIGGGRTRIGDHSAVASGGKIISGSNTLDAMSMSAVSPRDLQTSKKSVTILEMYAVVLTNAVVLPGVTLHEGAVLAAGSVATKDIPAWQVWGGVPAKFIRRRVVR